MKITPHDINTYLVASCSRKDDSHIVDMGELTCSCEAFQNNQTCKHLREVLLTRGRLRKQLKSLKPLTIYPVAV